MFLTYSMIGMEVYPYFVMQCLRVVSIHESVCAIIYIVKSYNMFIFMRSSSLFQLLCNMRHLTHLLPQLWLCRDISVWQNIVFLEKKACQIQIYLQRVFCYISGIFNILSTLCPQLANWKTSVVIFNIWIFLLWIFAFEISKHQMFVWYTNV